MLHQQTLICKYQHFAADILRVNDDLSRVLEYYRRIFGMPPLASPTSTGPATTPATQTVAAEVGVGAGGGAGASASTLIDLGGTSQQAESTETSVPSVLENELKALGKSDYNYWSGEF